MLRVDLSPTRPLMFNQAYGDDDDDDTPERTITRFAPELPSYKAVVPPVSTSSRQSPLSLPKEAPEINANTSHSSFVDKDGNGVSMTSSIEFGFGSGLETLSGFILNSTMSDFTLDGYKTNSPNKIAPNKRPRSAMCPIIVKDIKNNDLRLLIGSPGGPAIIGFLVRRIIDILDNGIISNKAVARPNYLPISNDTNIEYEKSLITDTEKEYFKNHNFNPIATPLWLSGFQAIEKDSGFLSGASDPRRDGVALGG